MFWNILFYAVIAVGALLFFGLLYYRIDWARHPEKYKDIVDADEKEKQKNAAKSTKKTGSKKSRKK